MLIAFILFFTLITHYFCSIHFRRFIGLGYYLFFGGPGAFREFFICFLVFLVSSFFSVFFFDSWQYSWVADFGGIIANWLGLGLIVAIYHK
jgi:hypothetical protein